MSRSYKRTPCFKCHIPGGKKLANRHIRRRNDIIGFSGYKKMYCRWEVIEYRSYCEEFYAMIGAGTDDKNLCKEMQRWWYDAYYWK